MFAEKICEKLQAKEKGKKESKSKQEICSVAKINFIEFIAM